MKRALCLLFLTFIAAVWSGVRDRIRNQRLHHRSLPRGAGALFPQLSPDGGRVAYLRSQIDIAADKRQRQIWMADTAGGGVRRISWGDDRPYSLDWSPSGALSFISSRGGSPQVWINPLDGSEPRAVTDLEQGVAGYWWTPDGNRLAVLATKEDDNAGDLDEVSQEGEADADAADGTVFDRLEDPEEFPQLWVVSVTEDGTGKDEQKRLTTPPINALGAAWSPDGATIALTYNPRFSGLVDEEQRVALVDVASGAMTTISPLDRHASMASFSPTGAGWRTSWTGRRTSGRTST